MHDRRHRDSVGSDALVGGIHDELGGICRRTTAGRHTTDTTAESVLQSDAINDVLKYIVVGLLDEQIVHTGLLRDRLTERAVE